MGRKPRTSQYEYYRRSPPGHEAVRKHIPTGKYEHVRWGGPNWIRLDEWYVQAWGLVTCTAEEAYKALPGSLSEDPRVFTSLFSEQL